MAVASYWRALFRAAHQLAVTGVLPGDVTHSTV